MFHSVQLVMWYRKFSNSEVTQLKNANPFLFSVMPTSKVSCEVLKMKKKKKQRARKRKSQMQRKSQKWVRWGGRGGVQAQWKWVGNFYVSVSSLDVIHSLAAYSMTHRHYGNIYSTWLPDGLLENETDWVSDFGLLWPHVWVYVCLRLCAYVCILCIPVSVCILACAVP